MSRVFLSHSRLDNRHAVALKRWLEQAEPGLIGEIYLDIDVDTGIQTGQRWTEALWRVNARCEAVICLMSGNWARSAECHAEYRQAEGMGKPIFCARIESFDETDVTRAWQSCDLFGDGPVEEVSVEGDDVVRFQVDGLRRLLRGLREVGIGADSFAWPPSEDPHRSPYRGWQPLESMDAAVYFGRDAQIVRALDELREMRAADNERIFVVLGPSGVGKSSFLRAGLLPRLQRDDRQYLTMPVVRPQRRALTGETGLARAILELRTTVGLSGPNLGDLKAAITDADTVRALLTEAAQAARNRWLDAKEAPPPSLVLPLDQAEELFDAAAGDEGPAFLGLLERLLDGVLDIIVVATIRSDRFEPLQTAPQLSSIGSRLFDRLRAMPSAQFTEVINGPARRASDGETRFGLAPELVDRLVEDASGGADTLPLLALTLSRLYEDFVGGEEVVSLERYEAMGGMRRVVQTEIDDLLSPDPVERAEQLGQLHDAFIPWLATINSDTDQPMRRIARWSELPESSHTLLNAFVSRRLLVKSDRDGEIVVEVALESLLSQWDELAQWLRAEASELREADAVERAAGAWERNDRHDDWLLDGTRLTDAETLSAKPGFNARLSVAREFLLESRRRVNDTLVREKAAAEAHAHKLRRRSQVLVALLAVIAVVAVFAVVSQQQARRAERAALAAERKAVAAKLIGQSRAILGDTGPGSNRRAIQQEVAAETLEPGADPDALLNTLIDTRSLVKTFSTPPCDYLFVNSDGTRVAFAGKGDNVIRQIDVGTGESIGNPMVGHTDAIGGIVYSRDGRFVASTAKDGTLRLWDARTGASQHVITDRADYFSALAFSRDGTLLANANRDGTVHITEVSTGRQLGSPIAAHRGWASAVGFSPDGSRLATGGADGTVRLWSVADHQPSGPPIRSHRGVVLGVEFSPGGRRIVSSSMFVSGVRTEAKKSVDDQNSTVEMSSQFRVTDASSGNSIVDGVTEPGQGTGFGISPDGQRVATAGSDGTVRVYETDGWKQIGETSSGHTQSLLNVAFSSDGQQIVSAGDSTVHVWAVDPDRSVGERLPGLSFAPFAPVAVSPDGRTVATRDANDESDIAFWRTDTGELLHTVVTGHRGVITALAWRPDGEVVGSVGAEDKTVLLWDSQTGAPRGQPVTGPQKLITSLSFSADGRRLAAQGLDAPWLWDLANDSTAGVALRGSEDFVSTVGFSADGLRLVTVAPVHLASEDHGTAEQTGNIFDAPDGTPSAVRVWNTTTGQPAGPAVTGRGGRMVDLATLEGDSSTMAAALSPDGQRILVSERDGLQWHDVESGLPTGEPWVVGTSGRRMVAALAFSADGEYVASADQRTSDIQLWDVASRRPIGGPLEGHTGPVMRLAFTAQGDRLLSQGGNGWMLWPGPKHWRDELCEKLTANMTKAEWGEWVSPNIPYQTACPSLK